MRTTVEKHQLMLDNNTFTDEEYYVAYPDKETVTKAQDFAAKSIDTHATYYKYKRNQGSIDKLIRCIVTAKLAEEVLYYYNHCAGWNPSPVDYEVYGVNDKKHAPDLQLFPEPGKVLNAHVKCQQHWMTGVTNGLSFAVNHIEHDPTPYVTNPVKNDIYFLFMHTKSGGYLFVGAAQCEAVTSNILAKPDLSAPEKEYLKNKKSCFSLKHLLQFNLVHKRFGDTGRFALESPISGYRRCPEYF